MKREDRVSSASLPEDWIQHANGDTSSTYPLNSKRETDGKGSNGTRVASNTSLTVGGIQRIQQFFSKISELGSRAQTLKAFGAENDRVEKRKHEAEEKLLKDENEKKQKIQLAAATEALGVATANFAAASADAGQVGKSVED